MLSVENILQEINNELKDVPGIVGVVLGGSRSRGTNHPTSDIDIGIYYDTSAGFDVRGVSEAATRLDDDHRENLVTSLGEWGAWINGGGWIVVQGYHVDLIFRDIKRVSQVIDDCLQGKVSTHYHTGHPHAYLNVMYMGEISICKILYECTNQISDLKAKTSPYPKSLKDAIIGYFMFEASFSLMFAKDNVDKDDITYVTGHCFRTISCLNQVLFALNDEYCINEKKAVRMIESFNQKPNNYKKNIDQIVTLISSDSDHTSEAVKMLHDLVSETEKILK
ncbi:MAG: nucleotidyltransferase domain-containing protein [Niallia sp.]|uniref:nucleotidyltransferase domain-containing protein n=1 Tax=Bacillus sp. J37 TaxID=935837 RepID=UPI00039D465E|nr:MULTISPECIES: nucleotidyltransferase domain-containing protein [Bacillaceae]QJX60747.1 nucleotidyltransferase domain-containing protein [Niallia circulans]SLL32041.1 nucleotidyltransferase domain-containing protein [Mycobacteroides abscessus subsp. abscessus]HWL25380.1 nucleotidyltransferase domain-containing protein [Ureibacillus sp.]